MWRDNKTPLERNNRGSPLPFFRRVSTTQSNGSKVKAGLLCSTTQRVTILIVFKVVLHRVPQADLSLGSIAEYLQKCLKVWLKKKPVNRVSYLAKGTSHK